MAMAVRKKKPVAGLFSEVSLLVDLPQRIGKGWEELLIRLGLSGVAIEHIDHDNRELKNKIKDGLRIWNRAKNQTSERKRATELFAALDAAEMKCLAEELEDEYCLDEPEHGGIKPDVLENSTESSSDIDMEDTRDILENPVNDKDDNSAIELAEDGPDINGDFSLRDYQTEIAKDGLRGENSIVWAGTGSGKTRVAIYIMKNHLDNNPTGRIAFFNTTLTLLDQQYKVICRFLPKYKEEIMKFSGKDRSSEDLSVAVPDCRVCVFTPMTLEKYLAAGTLSLDVFSMLVFDECHHTRKNEPYNQIMAHYRTLEASTAKLPQILGLTASVGTERAWRVQDAADSIIDLMARMDVHKIATPRDNIDEYRRFVPEPIKHSELMKDRRTDPIRNTIEGAMERIEGWLIKKLCDLDKDVYDLLEERPDNKRMEPQYQSWLSRLLVALPLSPELTPNVKQQAIVVTEHLTMYYTALTVNNTLSMKDVLQHLYRSSLKYKILQAEDKNAVIIGRTSEDHTGSDDTAVDNTGSDNTGFTNVSLYKGVVKKLEDLSNNQAYENPNIVRLQEMVDNNFREKGEDSLFIVFVETRESAIAVSKYLREKSVFANCCHLVSARSTADDDGSQSEAERNRVVKKLRTKRINGVVATQVAEEGLDIPACNLVIRYNKTSNEISTIQAAGRSRTMHGTIIDFANQQKRRQEQVNVMRLTLMNEALENILRQPEDDIRRKVTQRMRTITNTEAEEERTRQAQTKIKTKDNFTLRCWKCQEVAVSGRGIRCYLTNQYIVVDRDFYNKVILRVNRKPKRYEEMMTKYKLNCKNCGCDWGEGNCSQKSDCFAVLKIKQFIVTDDDTGKKYSRVAWSRLPFIVQPMTEEDFSSLAAVADLTERFPD